MEYTITMLLSNGEEIPLVEGGVNQHFVTICQDSAEFKDIWDKFTEENLSTVELKKNGNTLMIIEGMKLEGTQAFVNNNNTLTCHFYMGGGVVVESPYARAGRILLGED